MSSGSSKSGLLMAKPLPQPPQPLSGVVEVKRKELPQRPLPNFPEESGKMAVAPGPGAYKPNGNAVTSRARGTSFSSVYSDHPDASERLSVDSGADYTSSEHGIELQDLRRDHQNDSDADTSNGRPDSPVTNYSSSSSTASSPQRTKLWRRRSVRSNSVVNITDLKLSISNGYTIIQPIVADTLLPVAQRPPPPVPSKLPRSRAGSSPKDMMKHMNSNAVQSMSKALPLRPEQATGGDQRPDATGLVSRENALQAQDRKDSSSSSRGNASTALENLMRSMSVSEPTSDTSVQQISQEVSDSRLSRPDLPYKAAGAEEKLSFEDRHPYTEVSSKVIEKHQKEGNSRIQDWVSSDASMTGKGVSPSSGDAERDVEKSSVRKFADAFSFPRGGRKTPKSAAGESANHFQHSSTQGSSATTPLDTAELQRTTINQSADDSRFQPMRSPTSSTSTRTAHGNKGSFELKQIQLPPIVPGVGRDEIVGVDERRLESKKSTELRTPATSGSITRKALPPMKAQAPAPIQLDALSPSGLPTKPKVGLGATMSSRQGANNTRKASLSPPTTGIRTPSPIKSESTLASKPPQISAVKSESVPVAKSLQVSPTRTTDNLINTSNSPVAAGTQPRAAGSLRTLPIPGVPVGPSVVVTAAENDETRLASKSPIGPSNPDMTLPSGRPWPFAQNVPIRQEILVPAPLLRDSHFDCYNNHSVMITSPNTFHPVGCMVCEVMDKSSRGVCSGCALRVCMNCWEELEATRGKDLENCCRALGREKRFEGRIRDQ